MSEQPETNDSVQKIEPYGYFQHGPQGLIECDKTAEGAIPMYHLAQAKVLMMRCEGMLEALSFLAQQFRIYEAHYAAKGNQEKANNNAEFARFAEKVIEGGTGGVWQGLLSQNEVDDIKKSIQGAINTSSQAQ